MNDKLTVVYSDERRELVYMMHTRLVEEGIEAFVVNDAMQIAVGEVPPGWVAAARVVVAEQDVDAAEAIVRQFNEENRKPDVEPDPQVSADDVAQTLLANEALDLPHCPDCGRPRMAVCPICQTARADFPMADAPPVANREQTSPADPMLVCTTCDEPFLPGYLAHCEWCGHDFGSGIRPTEPAQVEPMDSRVVVVVLGLAFGVLAIIAYFAMLVSQ